MLGSIPFERLAFTNHDQTQSTANITCEEISYFSEVVRYPEGYLPTMQRSKSLPMGGSALDQLPSVVLSVDRRSVLREGQIRPPL